jgi:hypothetical protein
VGDGVGRTVLLVGDWVYIHPGQKRAEAVDVVVDVDVVGDGDVNDSAQPPRDGDGR